MPTFILNHEVCHPLSWYMLFDTKRAYLKADQKQTSQFFPDKSKLIKWYFLLLFKRIIVQNKRTMDRIYDWNIGEIEHYLNLISNDIESFKEWHYLQPSFRSIFMYKRRCKSLSSLRYFQSFISLLSHDISIS